MTNNEYQNKIDSILLDVRLSLNQQKYEKAFKIINTLYPSKNLEVLLLRAEILYSKKEYQLCLKDLELCESIDPKALKAYQLHAKTLLKMFNIEKAKSLIETCEQLNNKNDDNITLRRKYEETSKYFEDKIKKNSKYKNYISFMKTLYENGLYLNKLDIKFQDNSNRSVVAKEDIFDKDILLKVPLNMLITLETAKDSEYGKYFTPHLHKKLNGPIHSLLSIFLLNELDKKEKSKWFFYFNFLPESYNSFPVFYSEAELKYLEGTQFLEIVQQKKEELKFDYNLLCNEIPNMQNRFSYDDYSRFRLIVSSRIFGVTIKGNKTDIIAPYADMLNHKRPKQTHWSYEDDFNAFVVTSEGSVKKGYEVFDSYGVKCNSRFLLNYGFTMENNDEGNEVRVTLRGEDYVYSGISSSYSKKMILNYDCANKNACTFYMSIRIYIVNLDMKKGGKLKDKISEKDCARPFSLEIESKMFVKIKELMEEYLSKYPTSYEEDLAYLKENKGKISFNEYNCYIIRIGEKKIFRYFKDMCDLMGEFFKMSKSDMQSIYEFCDKKIILDDNNTFIKKVSRYKNYILMLNNLLNDDLI